MLMDVQMPELDDYVTKSVDWSELFGKMARLLKQ